MITPMPIAPPVTIENFPSNMHGPFNSTNQTTNQFNSDCEKLNKLQRKSKC